MSERIKVRMKFEKTGVVKFIGHLDIMRYFQKANRRAGLDIAYSGGYSPHQILSFAAPLGVGLESYGEYLDVEMESITSSQDIMDRLNQVNVPGIRVTNVVRLPEGTANAMASVAAARYQVRFREGYEPRFDYVGQLENFLSREDIPYEKETKNGSKVLNLRNAIYECKVLGDAENHPAGLEMLVNASSAGNIKPGMVMEALYSFCGDKLPEFALAVTRVDTYTNTGTEEEPNYVPLDSVGERF